MNKNLLKAIPRKKMLPVDVLMNNFFQTCRESVFLIVVKIFQSMKQEVNIQVFHEAKIL